MRPGHFVCDAQHFLCASARGRLAELGHLDELPKNGSAPHLFEPVDGDPVCRVRCSQAIASSTTLNPVKRLLMSLMVITYSFLFIYFYFMFKSVLYHV